MSSSQEKLQEDRRRRRLNNIIWILGLLLFAAMYHDIAKSKIRPLYMPPTGHYGYSKNKKPQKPSYIVHPPAAAVFLQFFLRRTHLISASLQMSGFQYHFT